MTNVLFILSGFIILLIYFCDANPCPNGVWDCTDQDSFRVCLKGNKTSEIYKCPLRYYCCQNKDIICDAEHNLTNCIHSKAKNARLITHKKHGEIIEIAKPINCENHGKVAILGSGCRKYLLCHLTSQGFEGIEHTCRDGFFFNPEMQQCTKNYVCPEIMTKKKLVKCTTIGKFVFDTKEFNCSKYLECDTVDGVNFKSNINICRNGTKFNPVLQECSDEYSCPTLSSEDLGNIRSKREDVTVTPSFLLNGRCTTIGRYQVDDSNCKQYVYCYALTNGTLQSSTFTCPTRTVFNQATQKCTATYQCPDTLCFYPLPRPNPNIPDCSSYIECEITEMITGFRGTVQYCEPGFKFDPMILDCSDMYQCPTA